MNPTPLGDAHPAFATPAPTHSTARRWRAGASIAALALIAAPLVAVPASAAESEPAAQSTPERTTELAAAADAPVFTGTLEANSEKAVGTSVWLSVSGTWAPEPESVDYAWFLSDDNVFDATDAPIAGADDVIFWLSPQHLGKYAIATMTATAGGATSERVVAEAVGPVTLGELAPGTPSISGTIRVGSQLTAQAGTWPDGTALAYEWRVSGATVATTSTFTPQAAHAGKTLRLVVTGTKDGYTPETAYSAFATVANATFTTTTPEINGTVKVGALVGATTGHFSPTASLTYRWKANGNPIAGATSRTYQIPARLHGAKLTVTVTGSKAGYTTKSVTSAASVVAKPFDRTSTPTISGTARVGQTLTANLGTWSPTPSVVTYQWRAEGRPIPGATSRTYRLTRNEHGKNISVEVTGRKYAYLPTTRRSAATDTVKWPVGISTPNVTTHPTRYVQTTVGRTVTLKVSATGGSLNYQWQRWTPATGTWTNMSGKTSSTLTFTAATMHDLNQFRAVVSNMAGKDTSNRTYMWVQSSFANPFSTYQWFGLWNFNAAVSDSVDDYEGYLAANVYICAAPGYHPTGNVSVQFVGSNGTVYPGAGQEQPDHVSNGVVLDADGCGYFGVYSEAPQSVRVGGRWRVTDRSDGQVTHQYAKYERMSLTEVGGAPSARALSGSETAKLDSPTGFVPVVETRGTLTD